MIDETLTSNSVANVIIESLKQLGTSERATSLQRYFKHPISICESLLPNKEDLMPKALGWLLRELGKNDASRLEQFLITHGPKIPRTTVRYAIEKFPKADRERLLKETR